MMRNVYRGTNVINILIILSICLFSSSCTGAEDAIAESASSTVSESDVQEIITGAERLGLYIPFLKDKSVGLVVNQSSKIGNRHIIDSLLQLDVEVTKIFAPEHGIRGDADAGARISDETDEKTGLPIVSLYGQKRQPSPEDMTGIEVMIFDIQDVGARFYTYISTMHYVMEACVAAGVPIIVLDRPNPNGFYVDGPVRQESLRSFIGMHPIPIVHGLTVGELAKMINGEGWLENGAQCDLTVIPCANYDHTMTYDLPVAPSPNLPNLRSVLLYPSLCLFEGTTVSVGRGTNTQFQVLGHPDYAEGSYTFTPKAGPGSANPKHKDQQLYGKSFTGIDVNDIKSEASIQLRWLIEFHRSLTSRDQPFFLENNFFDKLAGTDDLRMQITTGVQEEQIRESWEPALSQYKEKRKKYLLYPDFDE